MIKDRSRTIVCLYLCKSRLAHCKDSVLVVPAQGGYIEHAYASTQWTRSQHAEDKSVCAHQRREYAMHQDPCPFFPPDIL